jgi:pimeloyl-ACP methyl ester carboxylesterase
MQPTTRYAKSGDVHIAYQVFGEGPDLVVAPGFVSHIENSWDEPRLARWLNKLGGFCRVIGFDKRGTGLSDRVAHLPHMDERMDDLRAVMDAVRIERAFPVWDFGGRFARRAVCRQSSGADPVAHPLWHFCTVSPLDCD